MLTDVSFQVQEMLSLHPDTEIFRDVYFVSHRHEQHCFSSRRPGVARFASKQCESRSPLFFVTIIFVIISQHQNNCYLLLSETEFAFKCYSIYSMHLLQVLRYFDYVFTGVFTFEMLIKVACVTLVCLEFFFLSAYNTVLPLHLLCCRWWS